jgi:mono/diheme cytochrome c family protein
MNSRAVATLLSLGAFALTDPARAAPPEPTSDRIAQGRALFAMRCARCHRSALAARGDILELESSLGPDLSFSGNRLRSAWVEQWLMAPTRLRPAGYIPSRYSVPSASGDRVDHSRLPAHTVLSAEEAKAAAAFLSSLVREPNPYPIASPAAGLRAEVHFSKLLPCAGCHRVGNTEGGLSGPELASAPKRLQRDWLAAYLADPPFWQKGLMPRIDLRSDQAAAMVEYLASGPVGSTSARGGGPASSPESKPPDDLSRTRPARIYRLLCSQCHGLRGNGHGINAPFLFVAPRNHSSAEEMARLSRQDVLNAIRSGGGAVGKSTLMPAWGAVLGASDLEALTDHVLGLSGAGRTARNP